MSDNAILMDFPNGTSTLKIYTSLPKDKGGGSKEKTKYFVPDQDGFITVPFDFEQLEFADAIIEDREQLKMHQSFKRTKNNIYNYTRCGVWEWFCTFTFAPDRVDRFDYKELSKKIRVWCNNIKRSNPDLKYLIIPEQHKNGAWHFHGLLADCPNLHFVDSGHKKNDDVIYNLQEWHYGFFTATKVRDAIRCAHYISKYITKELTQELDGKQRYFVSQGLKNWTETRLEIPFHDWEQITRYVCDSLGKDIKHLKQVDTAFVTCRYLELQ